MSKFGEWEGYNGEECERCGRVRVEHYSHGFDICEKCRWCKQLQDFIADDDFYNETDADKEADEWRKDG